MMILIVLTMIGMLVVTKLDVSADTIESDILYSHFIATAAYIVLRASRLALISGSMLFTAGDKSSDFVLLASRGKRALKVSIGGSIAGNTQLDA